MDRRSFLGALAAGLLASRGVADAQSPRAVRVGYLSPLSPSADSVHLDALRRGLSDVGYVEGQTVTIIARHADGRYDRLPQLAAELVRLNVDVIVAAPTPAVRAALNATRSIPIVMAFSGDPVGEGFVTSLARPGGNVTGNSAAVAELAAKRVEFLKTVSPAMSHVALLYTPTEPRQTLLGTEAAGRTLNVRIATFPVRTHGDVVAAFAAMKRTPVDGLVVSLTLQGHWRAILDLAAAGRLPSVSGPREFVDEGGLLAYGPDFPELFRRSAVYVDKVVKGAKPAEVPVEEPSSFDFAVNVRTARTLGITLPPSVLVRANHVVE